MTPAAGPALSRRERIALAAFVGFPFAVYLLLVALGYVSYLKLAAFGAIAMVTAVALFLQPRAALWVLLAYIFVGPETPLAGAAGPMVLLILAGVLFGMMRGEPNRVVDPLFWYSNGFLVLLSVGSVLFAQSPGVAAAEMSRYAKCLLVVCLIVQLVHTPGQLRRMTNVIFVAAVGTVFMGAANLLLGRADPQATFVAGEQTAQYMLRFTGAHTNPNLAAAVMCSALPLGIFGLMNTHSRRRWFYVAGIVILIVAMFATYSRSVMVPFACLVAAVLVREARSRRAYLTIACLIALGVMLAPHTYWDRVLGLREAFSSQALDWSVYLRWLAMHTAWEMFMQHPLTGVGIGNFIVASSYQLFIRIPVHNSYLEILVGVGVFGLVAFLFALLSGYRHSLAGIRHRWSRHPAWMRSASFYWTLSGVSICLSAAFGNLCFRYFLWVPVAAGLVIGNLLREDIRDNA